MMLSSDYWPLVARSRNTTVYHANFCPTNSSDNAHSFSASEFDTTSGFASALIWQSARCAPQFLLPFFVSPTP